jgi:BirA family biotin operon repressor/biotin-[acetyl-CoA-carboxylase] ligase
VRATNAPLTHESIQRRLTTRAIGAHLVVYDEVDSTNRAAAALASNKAPHGTVVVAETQTQGRGRLGRVWISPPGVNLYFSILLHPPAPPRTATWLPLSTALAVVRAINQVTGLACRLKWPNDIIVDQTHPSLKLAGVLAEAADSQVVVGIGVNVNMVSDAMPLELRSIATSILMETGRWVDRVDLLAHILEEVEQIYETGHSSLDESMSAYRACCSTLGKPVQVKLVGGSVLEGLAEAIATDGALCLRRRDGSLLEIRAGDVVHLR